MLLSTHTPNLKKKNEVAALKEPNEGSKEEGGQIKSFRKKKRTISLLDHRQCYTEEELGAVPCMISCAQWMDELSTGDVLQVPNIEILQFSSLQNKVHLLELTQSTPATVQWS